MGNARLDAMVKGSMRQSKAMVLAMWRLAEVSPETATAIKEGFEKDLANLGTASDQDDPDVVVAKEWVAFAAGMDVTTEGV